VRQPDPTAPADLSPESAPGDAPVESPLDPELLALAAPPQAQRWTALTVMAAAVVAMLALLISLRHDMLYALAVRTPVELGDVRNVVPSQLSSNSYVSLSAVPTIARAVRFRRGLGSSYVVFPLSGQRTIYVQMPDDGGEGFVHAEYSGRLVTFANLGGRYAQLAKVMREETGLPVTGESFLLLAGEQPGDYMWTWMIGIICALFTALDVYFIVRWFKPLTWTQVERSKLR
jgi:hypothetical protein